ncbi:MAG: HAD family hydrolase [Saccharofermentanales bacterium]
MSGSAFYRIVLFDLDGTLLDTLQDLGDSVNHALGLAGFPLLDYEEYRQIVGHGVTNLCSESLRRSMASYVSGPGGPEPDSVQFKSIASSVLTDFQNRYKDHLNHKTRPYPGITGALKSIRDTGSILCVLSNKSQTFTEKLVSAHFPMIDFSYIIGDGGVFPRKPDPSAIRFILDESGCTGKDAVLFGDGETDILAARAAGIDAVAVCWGFRDRAALAAAGAAAFINSPAEIPDIVFEGIQNG